MTNLILVAALAPSALLIGWALWVHFTRPGEDTFLERRDDWGRTLMQTFFALIGTILAVILLAAALIGCAGGPVARHADQNRDYARNCGAAMDELGLCRP